MNHCIMALFFTFLMPLLLACFVDKVEYFFIVNWRNIMSII